MMQAPTWPGEMPVRLAHEAARPLWIAARQALHGTWFERADRLLGELAEREPTVALVPAYRAVADKLLLRDPTANVATARALTHHDGDVPRRMVDALVGYAEHNYDAAEHALLDVLAAYPSDPYARHRLGSLFVGSGRADDAAEVLRALTADCPDYAPAWNHYGYALLELADVEGAQAAFTQFLTLCPDNPSAHDSMADLLAQRGEREAAIGHLTRAVLIEPNFAYGWLHIGDLVRDAGALQQARAAYARAAQCAEQYGPGLQEALDRRRSALNAPRG
jgi:tetratricopeptide (TPR) repeat protein